MNDSDDTMLFAVVFVVIFAGIFTIVFGLGEVHGREEYKNELHQQLKKQPTFERKYCIDRETERGEK